MPATRGEVIQQLLGLTPLAIRVLEQQLRQGSERTAKYVVTVAIEHLPAEEKAPPSSAGANVGSVTELMSRRDRLIAAMRADRMGPGR